MEVSQFSKQERMPYIDFLKFLGLTAIITAHVSPPDGIMMLRNFDVSMMVIISSILGKRSYRKYEGKGIASAGNYVISRIKRLVIPTWMFLTLYFCLEFLMGQRWEAAYYIKSYCLTRYGIGYVWIILIYLYSALWIPLFSKMKLSLKSTVLVVTAYCLYELIYFFEIGVDNKFLDTTLFYIVPYGLLTYLGYHFCRMGKKTKLAIAMAALLVFVVFGIYYWIGNGAPQSVQIAKYPPRLYYLGYGVACSFLLLAFCEKHTFKIYDNLVVKYISVHSMGIYLWHILALSLYDRFQLPKVWYIKLIVVYASALVMVYVGNKLLHLIHLKK